MLLGGRRFLAMSTSSPQAKQRLPVMVASALTHTSNLTSRRVRLNGGAPLTVDSELNLVPQHIWTAGAMTTDCRSGAVSHSVVLAAHSYGFMLLKNASAPGCFTYE